ncbi:MAG: UDP-4-amino-4,6-dideoxy-N-acetyl-beta-L-altrosamine transaminase [Rhodospirillaceae bacterium]
MKTLPYTRHSLNEDDIAAVVEVLRGNWLTTGPAVGRFESALVEVTGARHAVACSSGTAALHLATLGTEIGPGDAVVVPTLTFLATANCVRYVGAEVVFADVDPETGLMRAKDVRDAIARAEHKNIAAILPVHLNGQTADVEAIVSVAQDHNALVLEDACHAIGGHHLSTGDAVGACRLTAAAAFSFHPAKTVAMGEGGAVTTNDDQLARRMRQLRNHGMSRDTGGFANAELAFAQSGSANPWYYEMTEPGYNYRASDIHCALGVSQLERLDARVAKRAALVARYDAALAERFPALRPLARVPDCVPAWHLYVVRIDFDALGNERAEVMERLSAHGIGTQVHYLPVHLQPYYRARYGALDLPGAQEYYAHCLSLPLFDSMSEKDVDNVVAQLEGILADG